MLVGGSVDVSPVSVPASVPVPGPVRVPVSVCMYGSGVMDFLCTIPMALVERAVSEAVDLDVATIRNKSAYLMGLVVHEARRQGVLSVGCRLEGLSVCWNSKTGGVKADVRADVGADVRADGAANIDKGIGIY